MHNDFTDAELTRAENRFYDEQEEPPPELDIDQMREEKEEREERRLANQ